MKNAIIIFVRKPELGKVKTRLAKDIGDEAALQVYKKLMLHTHNITAALNCHKYVFYASEIVENDLWDSSIYYKKAQAGTELGSRMQQAFDSLFLLGYNKVIIIGSDCPGLTANDIDNAFERLHHTDVVLGPAVDGGYYLLGLTQPFPQLFTNKNWSTESVLADTIADIKQSRKQYSLLEKLTDIDTLADLENYPNLLA
jgi:uncharacterized protein